MAQIWADLRFALRSMGRRWTFFATAIAMLAGSLGATTAMFGLARSLLLSPLPLPDSEQLSVLWTTRAEENRLRASLPDFYDWRARTKTLSHRQGCVPGSSRCHYRRDPRWGCPATTWSEISSGLSG